MTTCLRAAIIAAGDGLRLRTKHPATVKPLVPVAGRPLCHWIAGSLNASGANDITVLLNSKATAAKESLSSAFPGVQWTFLQKDTASSWESFRLVCRHMAAAGSNFIVTTVDCLVAPEELARFANLAQKSGADAALALTTFVNDEKPLWADVAGSRVTALGPKAKQKQRVTAGVYYITTGLAKTMPEAGDHSSLRSYLSSIVESRTVAGITLSKTLDIDRPEDIDEAESFIQWPIA
jgi:NDP-sugar pyrophosphorylase family protein